MKKKKVKVFLGILIGLIFLILFLRGIDFREVIKHSLKVKWWAILLTMACVLISILYRALRWRYLLEDFKKEISFKSLFSATMIGFMGNCVLPARAGEFLRVYSLSKTENKSFGYILGSIVIERVFDSFSLLACLFISFYFIGATGEMKDIAFMFVIACIIGFFLMILIAFFNKFFIGLLEKIPIINKFEKFKGFLTNIIISLKVLKNIKALIYAVIYSAAVWFFMGIGMYILMLGFEFAPYVSMDLGFFVLAVSSLGVILPAAPGFTGTYHYFMAKGLELGNYYLSLPQHSDMRKAYAIMIHLVNMVPIIVVGLYYYFKQHLNIVNIDEDNKK